MIGDSCSANARGGVRLAADRAELERHRITQLQGQARFVTPQAIEVTRYHEAPRRITADVFLLATGSRPAHPDEIPFDGRVVVDSDDVLSLTEIPGRLIVIGGGVVGCEYASIFAALGVRVTLVNAKSRLLTLDTDLSTPLRQAHAAASARRSCSTPPSPSASEAMGVARCRRP
jgi:NAD(P) transhydrogenase